MAENQASLITAAQCRMARACLRWSLEDLAKAAGVGRATIHRFENDEDIKPVTIAKLRLALEAKGVRFVNSGSFAGAVYYFGTASLPV